MKAMMAALALTTATLLPGAGQAQTVTVGTADTVTGFPFGANAYLGGYIFQQVYAASSFNTPLTIRSLTFFDSYLSPYAGGTPGTGGYDLYLSTTTAPVTGFGLNKSVPFASPAFTPVFSGTIPALAKGKLTFALSTPFRYDPDAGNLLLTVRNRDLSGYGATLYLNADRNVGLTDIRTSSYPYRYDVGLVTGFTGSVPEPASWALMILGFGAAGAALRRRPAPWLRAA